MLEGTATMGSLKSILDGASSPMTGQKVRVQSYKTNASLSLETWSPSSSVKAMVCSRQICVSASFEECIAQGQLQYINKNLTAAND